MRRAEGGIPVVRGFALPEIKADLSRRRTGVSGVALFLPDVGAPYEPRCAALPRPYPPNRPAGLPR